MGLNFDAPILPITFSPVHGIDWEEFGIRKQILANVEFQWSVGIVVNKNAGVDMGGKKIVKAGTPMTGDLDKRTTAFTKATTSNVKGVLLHDVDVTKGDNNGTLLLFGFVNTNRLDSDVKTMLTDTIKNALGMIKFLAC